MIYQDLLELPALKDYAAALNARARKFGAGDRLTAAQLRERILESAGRCEWCDRSLVAAEFELDHVVSLANGGPNRPRNLVVACPDCNRRKGQKHPARFAAEIYSETMTQTRLLRRIFRHFAWNPARQQSLFAPNADANRAADELDSQTPGAALYRWTE